MVGQQQPLTVAAIDASGQPVAGLPFSINIQGANASQLNGTTGPDGRAQLSYAGTNGGTDLVQATALISGIATSSNLAAVIWTAPPPPTTAGGDPPSITNVTPVAGAVITSPTSVTAVITPATGDTLDSYSITLQSTAAGSSPQTLASGTGAPPPSLATLDPTKVSPGSYTLTINATATAGGSVSSFEDIQLQTVPTQPAPITTGHAPSVANVQPANGALVSTTTPVTATITPAPGDSINVYSVTLQPAGGGQTTTISSGSGAPPATLATLDPSTLANGDYALTITVIATSFASAQTTLYVTVANSAPVVPPSITATPAQSTLTQGQPVSVSVTVTNTSSTTCQISTLPQAIAITAMSINGVDQSLDGSSTEGVVALDWSGSYVPVPPNGSVTINLQGLTDPSNPGASLLDSMDITDETYAVWHIDQPGQYNLRVRYASQDVPGATDPCTGVSAPSTVTFAVTTPTSTAARALAAAAPPSCSPNPVLYPKLPSYVCMPEATAGGDSPVARLANDCFTQWAFPNIGDAGNVVSDLDRWLNPGGIFAGYQITIVDLFGTYMSIMQKKNGDAAYINNFSDELHGNQQVRSRPHTWNLVR